MYYNILNGGINTAFVPICRNKNDDGSDRHHCKLVFLTAVISKLFENYIPDWNFPFISTKDNISLGSRHNNTKSCVLLPKQTVICQVTKVASLAPRSPGPSLARSLQHPTRDI